MNKRQFNKIINSCMQEEVNSLEAHEQIKELLKSFEGKKITSNKVNKILPEGFEATTNVNGLEVKDNKGRNHFVSYFSQMHEYKTKNFELCDIPYFRGATERIQKLKDLDLDLVFKACKELEKSLNILSKVVNGKELDNYKNPATYYLREQIFNEVEGLEAWRIKELKRVI